MAATTMPRKRRPRPRGSQQAQRTCAHCTAPMIPGENWWPRGRVGRNPGPYVCRPCERRSAAQYATKLERRYSTAQYQARKRGVPWCISYATYKDLLKPNVCSCCSEPLSPTGGGLDRIDGTKPYTRANVVAICGSCRCGASRSASRKRCSSWSDAGRSSWRRCRLLAGLCGPLVARATTTLMPSARSGAAATARTFGAAAKNAGPVVGGRGPVAGWWNA